MTDLDPRALPPLEPADPPARQSQTLLAHADRCRRSAHLYEKYKGGAPSAPMSRGSAYHAAKARCLAVMVEQNEATIPSDLAKSILLEVLDEHPEWTIPLAEQDALRQMMHHFATGRTIQPEQIIAVERKFVLELDSGIVLSGIIDEASIDGSTVRIGDDKTQWALPTEAEYAGSFQCRFYAVLFAYGQPENDDGTRDPCLGERVASFEMVERFPRYMHDEQMAERRVTFNRLEVQEARRDIERLSAQVSRAFQTGEFPATHGSHCSICPAEWECPLPRELRSYAGAINTLQEAQEASVWLERWWPRLRATRREIRNWASQHGAFRFGLDREWVFEVRVTRDTDWPALEAAVESARQYGTPFDPAAHRRQRAHTAFDAKTVGRDTTTQED